MVVQLAEGCAQQARPATIRVMPENVTVRSRAGESVWQALERAGFSCAGPCGGAGSCGKCRVQIESHQAVPLTDHPHLSEADTRRGIRLACQLYPHGDLTVHLPDHWRHEPAPARRSMRWHRVEQSSPAEQLGLAVDLGTTTVAATLVALDREAELGTASCRNPQAVFGQDVITRIQKGSSPVGLSQLNQAVRGALATLVTELCEGAHADPDWIVDVVLGGNPAMLQLAANVDPAPLGQAPFRASIEGGRTYSARTFGLAVNPAATAYVPPITHAFVGSDISAGWLVADELLYGSEPMLFVDMGTNGELVLRSGSDLVATSTAAGPAFEGAGLRSGMPAVAGAVYGVGLEEGDLAFDCVGDAAPRGLCGSGVLDLVARLLHLGALDSTGRMTRATDAAHLPERIRSRLLELGGRPAIRVTDDVFFTQEDVRQVQLAKGAIRTGIDLLLAELDLARPARVVLAGGFGNQLRPSSLTAVGLLPAGLDADVAFAGNTSRAGCVRLLRNAALRRTLKARMQSVRYVSLAERAGYLDRYVANLEFPTWPTVHQNAS